MFLKKLNFIRFQTNVKKSERGEVLMSLNISSPVFNNESNIPEKYTCDGKDVNPPLNIEGVPEGSETLALIVDDPDAPPGTWDHWIVYNISPETTEIKEDSVPGEQALNDFQKNDYGGPCPPSGTHRYFFKIYALDTNLDLPNNADKEDVLEAMEGHVIEEDKIVGMYG